MPEQNPKLKDTVILFDRDQGISIFQNIRGYNNLTDDAEWLLERTPQKSRGFILRPISKDGQEGIWVGEYTHAGNQITRQDLIYNRNGSAMSKMISVLRGLLGLPRLRSDLLAREPLEEDRQDVERS